jgi:NTP-dependent ternary system trypsin peptidase co-occuring protein
MPERRFLEHGNATIHIEVGAPETAAGPAVGPRFVRAVQALAKLIGDGIADMEKPPDQIEIRFAVGMSADGSFLITRSREAANFEVRMLWGGGATPFSPPLPPPQE